MKIWIDIKNSHEPLFFKSLLDYLKEHSIYISCRRFAEIDGLLRKYGIDHEIIGTRPEGSLIKRALGLALRVLQLYFKVPKFDVALNHMSIWAVYTSKMRFKRNITFGDNEIDHRINRQMFKFVDYFIAPKAISRKILIEDGMREKNIYQFDGYKEDIYVADFNPDPNFLTELPFRDFVTVRPESTQATYVPKNVVSIVPKLLAELSRKKVDVLYLPRYKSDRDYARSLSHIYIPPKPLNGLDTCFYSRAVLSGAGTFAREAACLGTPAVSFFPGHQLLAVDQEMLSEGWIYHSRQVSEIVDYVMNSKKKEKDLSRSKRTKKEVLGYIEKILQNRKAR